jgi:hypothetical protein
MINRSGLAAIAATAACVPFLLTSLGSPAVAAGFLGDTVHVYYDNPTQASVYLDMGSFPVPGSASACFAYCPQLSVSVTGDEVTISNTSGFGVPYDSHPFNGFTVSDVTRDPHISGVTLDSSTTAPVSVSDASWTSSSVSVNFQGQTWSAGQQAVFDVQFSAIPEPGAWAMMLVGFGGLGAALRSRRQVLENGADVLPMR